MAIDRYLESADWHELERAEVLGRPALMFRKRLRHVLDLLDLSVADPSHDFLVQAERRISHGAFRQAVEAGAAALADQGVTAGDRVLIVLYNSPEFWLAQWAAWRIGAIPVLGNRWWSDRDLAEALYRVRPRLLVTDLPYVDDGRIALTHMTPEAVCDWWSLRPTENPAPDPRKMSDEDDVAVIVFTAGSTGAPKGVQLTHRALVWTQQTIHVLRGAAPARPASPSAQKVALKTTPLFHNGGMVAAIGSLIDGGRIVMLRGKFDPVEAMRLIETERVGSWSAVPTMFRRVLQHPRLRDHDLSSLAAPATGGAIVSRQFIHELREGLPIAGAGFSSGYGMTEMSFLTLVGAADLDAQAGTVGRPIHGVELRVDKPGPDGEGELVARSGALMAGYFDSDESPIDPEGWYHSGDLGRIDENGFVYVTGRLKDMVIRGGENIACAHVEAAIAAHPDVLEIAVVGYPDAEYGEALAAIVHARPKVGLDEAALRGFVKGRLAYFETPTHWEFRDQQLPTLATGKIDKPALAKDLAERVAAAQASGSPDADRP